MEDFKKGQPVRVLLDREHGLEGDSTTHAGKFITYHVGDKTWADVELDEKHAGQTKKLSVPVTALRALLALFALLVLSGSARAQFVGYTSPQTVNQQIFSGVNTTQVSPSSNATPSACTKVPITVAACAIPNLGQSIHYVTVRWSAAHNFRLTLEGSNDGTNWFAMGESSSDAGLDSAAPGFAGFFASGSFTAYRLNLQVGNGSGTMQAWYSGTSTSTGQPGGNFNGSSTFRRVLAVAPNTAVTLTATTKTIYPTAGSTAGQVIFQFQTNACAGGSLLIQSGADTNHLTTLTTIVPANSLALQTFTLPSAPAAGMTFGYTPCGTETYDTLMLFAAAPPPGGTGTGAGQVQTTGADPCASTAIAKSSAVVTAPAAATTQMIAGVAGQTISVCGYHLGVVTAVAGTYQWTTGTGGACGAATVTKTGAVPINAGGIAPFSYGPGATLFTAAAGSGVCLTLTGAGDNAAGIVTFVQQ